MYISWLSIPFLSYVFVSAQTWEFVTFSIIVYFGAYIMSDLASRTLSSWLLCPFNKYPSFFLYVFTLGHKTMFQTHLELPTSVLASALFASEEMVLGTKSTAMGVSLLGPQP